MFFPDEIKDATSAMNHKIRWRIVELLQETEKLAYTELLDRLKIRKGSLNHHLTRLMEAGILDNYSKGEFSGPYNSYYTLSAFGTDFVNGLLSSVEVTVPIQTTTKSVPIRTGLVFENFDNKPSERAYITNLLQALLYNKHESKRRNLLNLGDFDEKNYSYSLRFRKMRDRKKLTRCIR